MVRSNGGGVVNFKSLAERDEVDKEINDGEGVDEHIEGVDEAVEDGVGEGVAQRVGEIVMEVCKAQQYIYIRILILIYTFGDLKRRLKH